MDEQIFAMIYEAVDEINAQLPAAERLAKAEDTVLAGAGGSLDSLALLNFLVAVEDRAMTHYGHILDLVGDEAILGADGPLGTLGSLGRFLAARLA